MKKKTTNKKENRSDDANNLFEKTLSMLNPKEGLPIFQTLASIKNKQLCGISTGSLGLDYVICPKAGGIPKGHCIEIYGPYSSGKSTLALGICANITINKKMVIYVDSERTFSWEMAHNSGIDEEYFRLCQHRDARLIANDLETLMKTNEVGAIVFDSIPVWKPLVEVKKGSDDIDITKSQMAFHASFLTTTLPILAQVASDHGTILIFINQERKNLSYGGGSVPYGCEALKHLDSVRLKLRGNPRIKDCKITDSDGNLVGQYVDVIADKNKISIPLKEARVPLFFGRGVNPYMEVAILAVKSGVVTNSAGHIKWASGGDNIVKGFDNFVQLLFDDLELYFKIRKEVITQLNLQYSSETYINSFHDHKGEKREAIVMSSPALIEDSNEETIDIEDKLDE